VVGCGGAGRAAAVAALRLGCQVTLANRTPARAAELAEELNAHLRDHAPIGIDTPAMADPAVDWIPVEDLPALAPDLVIYTVPGPMEGFTSALRRDPEPTTLQQSDNQAVTNQGVPGPYKKEQTWNQQKRNHQSINSLQNDKCQVSQPDGCQTSSPDGCQASPFPFPDAVILEANYRTPCLEGCGRAYISGLRWLLYQAVAGYEIFTGETPDADAMFRIFC
jgi:shikimate 5-dehydrogenase